jgi:hypothetical protein
MGESEEAVESSEDGDDDMDEDVEESPEDAEVDFLEMILASSESGTDDSDAESSIEVRAAASLDDVGTVLRTVPRLSTPPFCGRLSWAWRLGIIFRGMWWLRTAGSSA